MLFDDLQYPYAVLALIALGLLVWRPVTGLVLLAAIFPMDPFSPRLPVAGINTETALLGVAFAVSLLRSGARVPPLRYSGPVIAFVATMGIAFAIGIPRYIGLSGPDGESAMWLTFRFWKSITFSSVLFFATYWWFQRPADRQRMLEALSIGVFISCVAALADYALGITTGGSLGRATGLQGDPNSTAEAIGSMMFVPLYLAWYARDLSFAKRSFYACVYALSFVSVVLSLSRGNWAAFVVAHAALLLLLNRRLLFAGAIGLALATTVAFPLLPQVVRDRIVMTTDVGRTVYRVPYAMQFEDSTASRIVLWKVGGDMFRRSPLWGNGLNAFFLRTPEFGARYGVLTQRDPHNLLVKLAAESGLIGLSVIAWLIAAVFLCGRRLWRSESGEYRLGAILLASGAHVLFASLSADGFLYAKQISAYFWILYALAARAYVDRFAGAAAPALATAAAGRWRRFSQSAAAAASQP